MAKNTKTILLVSTIASVIILLVGAGYALVDSTAKIDTSIELHDTSPVSHIHLRHAVTAVSESTGAIQDSLQQQAKILISMKFQLQRIEEIVQELKDN